MKEKKKQTQYMHALTVISVLACAVLGAGLSGCYYDKENILYPNTKTFDCSVVSAKFTADVLPLIQKSCATSGCHTAADAAGGTVLVTYADISGKAARINQRAVIDQTMPSSGPLTPAEIAILKCWIDAGAPNN